MNKITRKNGGGQPGFHLDKRNAKLAGVCAGIADYANVDPTVVRIAFVVGAFFSLGTAALVYLAIALIAD
ncbi:MAG: PspC domain-containing protein [Erythrobacter sp.]|uniref:PspC domain-containing protein n=1 Tax=Erythrobacter sp. HL-111 TaxID=1798193 RepID=UPI0006DB0230|nr:PspC domain-containing protein [Erythrobacter sp. HL-111]KPP91476.1 MAG: phage shock protein C (PspC) family protein [Erythrobacteraceae bacterium HL-111]SDS25691.1 phage shock protein C (PspC) family protein [Erythrobacter sp. HL-111]